MASVTKTRNNTNIFNSFTPCCGKSFYLDCKVTIDTIIRTYIMNNTEQSVDPSAQEEVCNGAANAMTTAMQNSRLSCQNVFNTTYLPNLLVRGVSITGEHEKLVEEGETGDCHHTLPKSNGLYRGWTYNITTSDSPNDLTSATEGQTPVWTLLWNGKKNSKDNGTAWFVQSPMTCLKALFKNEADDATKNDGDGAATALVATGGIWAAISSAVAIVFSAFMV